MIWKVATSALSALLGTQAAAAEEQSVIVSFDYGRPGLADLYSLEDALPGLVAATGEYDGHEIAVDLSHGRLYFYGPDADALVSSILPALERTEFMSGAVLLLRYGPPENGVRSREITLN